MMKRQTNHKHILEKSIIIAITVAFYLLSSYSIGSIVIMLLALMLYCVHAFRHNWKAIISVDSVMIITLIFGIYGFSSQLWAVNSGYARARGITVIEMVVFMLLIFPTMGESFTSDELLSMQRWSGHIVVLSAILFYGPGEIINTIVNGERLTNEFINSNTLGMLAALTFVISFYYFLQKGWNASNLLDILCIIIVASTGSRKALVVLALGSVFITYYLKRGNNLVNKILVLVTIAALFVLVVNIADMFHLFAGANQRIEYLVNLITGSGKVDHSALVRRRLIEIGMDQFRKTPWFGIGLDNGKVLSLKFLGIEDYYLHNNYVELLVGTGIIGTAIYYLIYVDILVRLWKNRKEKTKVYYLIMFFIIARLILDYGSVSYYSKETYMNLLIYTSYLKNEKNMYSTNIILKSRRRG